MVVSEVRFGYLVPERPVSAHPVSGSSGERSRPQRGMGGRLASTPWLQLRWRAAPEQPCGQFPRVCPGGKPRDKIGEHSIDEFRRPITTGEPSIKVRQVHLDLAPPPVWQQRDSVFSSAEGPHGTGPAVVGQVGEQAIQSGSPMHRVVEDLVRITLRPGFDCGCPTDCTTGVLLHNVPAHDTLDTAAHRLGIRARWVRTWPTVQPGSSDARRATESLTPTIRSFMRA
jgi:hypothetical protein